MANQTGIKETNALIGMPIGQLEELIGARLLEGGLGMKNASSSTKREITRNWWQKHLNALRDVVCSNATIRNTLFSDSEKDRNAAIATVIDTMTADYTGMPVANLIALACHYGLDKVCAEHVEPKTD